MNYSINDLINNIGVEHKLVGNLKLSFTNISPYFEAIPNSLIWIKSGNSAIDQIVTSSNASCIICHHSYSPSETSLKSKCFILVERPEIAFLRLVKNLHSPKKTNITSIHPTAIIHPQAKLGSNIAIGPYCIIENCEIGDHVIIEPHTIIKGNVKIGSNVLISEHCNIGGQGFGYIKNENDAYENMEHIGSVLIEDDVALFPYCNVDRGTLSKTIIGKGTKIDHYCHIGHNTQTGTNTIITAKVVLCGSSKVGNNSWIGVGSVIKDGVKVGDDVIIGMGSMVTKNVPNNQTWLGSPAKPIAEQIALNKKLTSL